MKNADINLVFLRQVMPDTGHIMVAPGVKSKGKWCDFTTRKTYESIIANNAEKDLYFCPSAFKQELRHVVQLDATKSIFLDIDAGAVKVAKHGDGKVYIDRDAALEALYQWIETENIPEPSWVIYSGCGLHVYWTMDEALEPMLWDLLLKGLHNAAAKFGLKYDNQVCRGNALMRLPGGTHQASGNPVVISKTEGTQTPYTYDALLKAFPVPAEVATRTARPSRVKTYAPVVLPARPKYLEDTDEPNDSWSNIGTGPVGERKFNPSNFDEIIKLSRQRGMNGCAFLKLALDGSQYLSRSLWRAALSIAEHCEDRDTAIHKLSRDYANYSVSETEQTATGTHGCPYTCDTISAECSAFDLQMKATKNSKNASDMDKAILTEAKKLAKNMGSACKLCTHKVTTPLQLGERRIFEVSTPEDYRERRKQEKKEKLDQITSSITTSTRDSIAYINQKIIDLSTPVPIIPSYICIETGTNRLIYKSSGEIFYPYPIFLVSRARDDKDGDDLEFHIESPADGTRVLNIPQAYIAMPQKLFAELAKLGILGDEEERVMLANYMIKSARLAQHQKAREMRKNFGWQEDDRFVHGPYEYGPDKDIQAARIRGCDDLMAAMSPDISANPLVWSEMAQKFTGKGFEPALFVMGLMAGAPLFHLGSMHGGLLHLFTSGSGYGKTTLARLALCMWGRTEASNKGSGLMALANDTPRALLVRLGLLGSLPTAVDELSQRDEQDISFLILSITQGRQPDRMDGQTNTLRPNTNTWDMPVLSTGNSSVVDHVSKLGSLTDAQLARVLELDCSELPDLCADAKSKEAREATKSALERELANLDRNHSGVVGRILAMYITNNVSVLRNEMLAVETETLAKLNFTKSERFWRGMMVCAIVGLRMLKRNGLLEYSEDQFVQYLDKLLKNTRRSRNMSATTPPEVITEYITSHMASAINVMNDESSIAQHHLSDVITSKYLIEDKVMFLNKKTLEKWLSENRYNVTDVNKYLLSIGAVNKHVNLMPATANRESRVRCWVIKGYNVEGNIVD